MSDSRVNENVDAPTIRIDEVHWQGEIWFEASISFANGRAASSMPQLTAADAEKSAYIIIIETLFFGATPCGSAELGSGVVESQIGEFNLEKLAVCCPLGLDCTKMTDLIFCPNWKSCRRANQEMASSRLC